MSEELKRCPFCAAAAEFYNRGDGLRVRCTNCPCELFFGGSDTDAARTDWNRRGGDAAGAAGGSEPITRDEFLLLYAWTTDPEAAPEVIRDLDALLLAAERRGAEEAAIRWATLLCSAHREPQPDCETCNHNRRWRKEVGLTAEAEFRESEIAARRALPPETGGEEEKKTDG